MIHIHTYMFVFIMGIKSCLPSLSNVRGVYKKVSVTHMQCTTEKGLTTVFPTRRAGALTWLNREIRTLQTQITENTRTTITECYWRLLETRGLTWMNREIRTLQTQMTKSNWSRNIITECDWRLLILCSLLPREL